MRLIIDIPKEVKQTFDNAKNEDLYGNYYDRNSLIGKAIQNGTPIPDNATMLSVTEWADKCRECGKMKVTYNGKEVEQVNYPVMPVIEQIRDEIQSNFENSTEPNNIDAMMRNIGREECLAIIEKYTKGENK